MAARTSRETLGLYRDCPARRQDRALLFAGAVTIESFEVSRWRGGCGDLPMYFQCCRRADWEHCGAKFDRWSSGRGLGEQNRLLPGVSRCGIEGGWTACRHTTAVHARACHEAERDRDVVGHGCLMSCQRCTSVG